MEKNKQVYQLIIHQLKRLEIIQTEFITKKQIELLLDLFIEYYIMIYFDNSEIKVRVSYKNEIL